MVAQPVDLAAYDQAIRRWALPPCLHVPVVAVDQLAIEDHIGRVIQVVSAGRAILVRPAPPPPRDARLPIWEHPNVDALFPSLQLWVSPDYTRYRRAWQRVLGSQSLEGKVLHHLYNRRLARLRGFGFIRLAPISRKTNSSSAFSEKWGVDLNTPAYVERMKKLGLRIQYGDLVDLMVMLDALPGGGVMEAVRLAQDMIRIKE